MASRNRFTKVLTGIILGGALVLSPVAANALGSSLTGTPVSSAQEQRAVGSGSNNVVKPMFWGYVIKILTTKTACENALRVMPGNADLKCMNAGKVWVIVPNGVF